MLHPVTVSRAWTPASSPGQLCRISPLQALEGQGQEANPPWWGPGCPAHPVRQVPRCDHGQPQPHRRALGTAAGQEQKFLSLFISVPTPWLRVPCSLVQVYEEETHRNQKMTSRCLGPLPSTTALPGVLAPAQVDTQNQRLLPGAFLGGPVRVNKEVDRELPAA